LLFFADLFPFLISTMEEFEFPRYPFFPLRDLFFLGDDTFSRGPFEIISLFLISIFLRDHPS